LSIRPSSSSSTQISSCLYSNSRIRGTKNRRKIENDGWLAASAEKRG
jgi:hypothetical protein